MPRRGDDELVRLELPREFVAELLEGLEMTRAVMRRVALEAGRPGDSAAAAATVRRAEAMMRLIERQRLPRKVNKSKSRQVESQGRVGR